MKNTRDVVLGVAAGKEERKAGKDGDVLVQLLPWRRWSGCLRRRMCPMNSPDTSNPPEAHTGVHIVEGSV